MKISFTKMHGIGNDFIIIDGINNDVTLLKNRETIKRLCRRKFGIGADQLLILAPSQKADFKMEIFNSDGDEVEMCGNGIRCLAQYLHIRTPSQKKFTIETLAGIIKPEIVEQDENYRHVAMVNSHEDLSSSPPIDGNHRVLSSGKTISMVKVDMGMPELEGAKISAKINGQIINYPIPIKNKTFLVTCVSMGNPHCVIFCDDLSIADIHLYGPLLEQHELFPNRTNVEFIQIIDAQTIKMKVWERGSGVTLACGTGACAAVVAAILTERTNRKVSVILDGGTLAIEWNEQNNQVYMTGPAEVVFDGTFIL